MITFDEVSIQKGDRTVLENISWEAKNNENWAIIGGNGSGKSTFLEAIAGKIFPTKGRITKPNYDEIAFVAKDYSFNRIVQAATQYYQQRFNSQDTEISPTVREILQNQIKPIGTVDEKSVDLPPLPYSENELIAAANLLKISHLLDRKIVTLSNGETRRTLITLSLLRKPKVLLLDNPFVGLDIDSRATLHQVLNQVAASGIQIIIVTTPKEIPSCITNIIQLQNGKIKKSSTQISDFQQVIHNLGIKINADILEIVKQISTKNDFDYALNMRNVTVTYKGVNVVDSVNWQVKRGEKWALMGPNGSGEKYDFEFDYGR
ncbi:MAG: ATP-binding cassette domain-containing protein [Emticicia sp.]|nr:ATP-binding cassette domain-containing protein [Emticicia sp.]